MASVRYRLLALFAAITAGAIGFVFLYVVPQLRSSLTAEKLERLERDGATPTPRIADAFTEGEDERELLAAVRAGARATGARVTVLGIRELGEQGLDAFVVADSAVESSAIEPSYIAAEAAIEGGGTASGTERLGDQDLGQTAFSVYRASEPIGAVVYTITLGDVDDSVALIERQILIAGVIALLVATIAGWLAAGWHARRLTQLERAAVRLAGGDFTADIPSQGGDEVAQLGRSLDEMRRQLARLDEARREFIANASHELRTPVFSLAGFVELLRDEEPDAEVREEFMRNMGEQIERLRRLTVDLLDLSKLDAGALDVAAEEIDLAALSRSVADEFGPLATRREAQITTPGSGARAPAFGDAGRVTQILRILLDNALIHTPTGTNVAITARRRGSEAAVTVSDDGPGMDPEVLDRAFERFWTGDEEGGSGLGLSIADELAQRMGGALEASVRRGRTQFTLILPAVRS